MAHRPTVSDAVAWPKRQQSTIRWFGVALVLVIGCIPLTSCDVSPVPVPTTGVDDEQNAGGEFEPGSSEGPDFGAGAQSGGDAAPPTNRCSDAQAHSDAPDEDAMNGAGSGDANESYVDAEPNDTGDARDATAETGDADGPDEARGRGPCTPSRQE